jgi:hypothetical protein
MAAEVFMRFGLASVLLVLVLGCGDDTFKQQGEPCFASSECAPGLVCDFGANPEPVCAEMGTPLPDASDIDAAPTIDADPAAPDAAPLPDAPPGTPDAAPTPDAPLPPDAMPTPDAAVPDATPPPDA